VTLAVERAPANAVEKRVERGSDRANGAERVGVSDRAGADDPPVDINVTEPVNPQLGAAGSGDKNGEPMDDVDDTTPPERTPRFSKPGSNDKASVGDRSGAAAPRAGKEDDSDEAGAEE